MARKRTGWLICQKFDEVENDDECGIFFEAVPIESRIAPVAIVEGEPIKLDYGDYLRALGAQKAMGNGATFKLRVGKVEVEACVARVRENENSQWEYRVNYDLESIPPRKTRKKAVVKKTKAKK